MALNSIVAGPASNSYASLVEANAYIANRPDSTNWLNKDYLERERVLEQAVIDIDTLRFRGDRLLTDDGGDDYSPQKLQFPRSWHEYYSGYATGGTTLTLVDTWFTSIRRPDDYFKYGSILILDGTNAGESREITGYTWSTATFTVGTAFTSAIDTTSSYIICAPIDMYVKYAQCEQALFLTNHSEIETKYAEWSHAGVTAVSIGDVSMRFGRGVPQTFSDRVGTNVSAGAFKYIRKFLDTDLKSGRA